jgi:hypothetical protein
MKYYMCMLINCPRCGFSQPKDQYCASCGVNIETYVPVKPSVWKKVFSSTAPQVFLVVVVALGISYYTIKANNSASPQNSRRKNIQQQSLSNSSLSNMNEGSNAQVVDSGQDQPQVSVELQSSEQQDRLTGNFSDSSVSSTPPDQMASAPTTRLTSPTTTTAAAMAAAAASVNLKVSYYEVSRTILAYWIENNGGNPFGLIDRKLFADQIRYAPLKTESTRAAVNVKTNFKSDANKEGVMIGFNSEILMSSPNTGSITLAKTTSQGTDNIRAYIETSPQNVFFVYWKNDLAGLQNEPVLSEVPPFQILKSRLFLDQKTELVLIVESIN